MFSLANWPGFLKIFSQYPLKNNIGNDFGLMIEAKLKSPLNVPFIRYYHCTGCVITVLSLYRLCDHCVVTVQVACGQSVAFMIRGGAREQYLERSDI